jgi:hypothetical protein
MEQLANDEDLREQAKQTFAKSGNELRELQQLSKKNPDQMTAQGTFSLFCPSNLIVAKNSCKPVFAIVHGATMARRAEFNFF